MYKIKSYNEFISEKNTMTESKKEIAGFKEVIEVVGLGKMKAKLDTGNTAYNAIIVQDYFEKNGKLQLVDMIWFGNSITRKFRLWKESMVRIQNSYIIICQKNKQ